MYRLLFSALFVLAIAVPAAIAQDPTKVDAKHYKVEFQNSRVRIVRAHYGRPMAASSLPIQTGRPKSET